MRYKYRKLILYVTIGIMGLGMATFTFSGAFSKDQPPASDAVGTAAGNLSGTPTPSGSNPSPSLSPEASPTATIFPSPDITAAPNQLLYDAYPEINELITSFMAAKLDSTSTFEEYVLNAELVDAEKYQRKTEYIKAYHNIHCYTKKGIREIDFVVYLVYDAELPTIDTYAPSIEELYISKDETGRPWIYFGEISQEMQDYFSQLRSESDVTDLIQSVNQAFQNALNEDSALNEFFNNLTSASSPEAE